MPDEVNKRHSALLHCIMTTASNGWTFHEGDDGASIAISASGDIGMDFGAPRQKGERKMDHQDARPECLKMAMQPNGGVISTRRKPTRLS